jgi:two-component system, OmpR family, sensor kinase
VSTTADRLLRAPRAVSTSIARLQARTPLRLKLVAALLLLVMAALVASGIAATATLRGYLTDRVDGQLQSVAHHIREHGLSAPPHEPPDGDEAVDAQLPSAFVVEVMGPHGAVLHGPTSNFVENNEPLPRLPHISGREAKHRGVQMFTTGAVDGGSQWRVLAGPLQLPNHAVGTLLVAQSLGDVDDTLGRLDFLLVVIGAVAVIVLAGVGYVVIRASLRPLREVEKTAAAIAAGDWSRRVPESDPHTEVGRLSAAFNTMLGRIETAFAVQAASEEAARRSENKMRRFVADASHELRTPLTSIRGFAELFRLKADGSYPTDTTRAMQRIEDEAKRMGVLVEDLLQLARLDEERPLRQQPVDLLQLASNAVHDAKVVATGREIDLVVGNTNPPPIVVGDPDRLPQVLGNLLSNALRHTPPSSPIQVRVASEINRNEPAAVLEVVDHGPGLSPEDTEHIFDRFYRADSPLSRNDGGTGLGLSIVAALVDKHRGRVSVHSTPGSGATFRVELPLAAGAPVSP